MKNSFIKIACLLAVLLSVCFSAYSQRGNPLQFFENISQSAIVNPAVQNKTEKLVVGFPVIGGTTTNWSANFAISDFHTSDFSFDYKNFYNSLDEYGDVFSLAQVSVIYLSLKRKNKTLSFSVSERFIGTSNFNPEILNFFAQGLQPYYGKNESVGPLGIKSQYYREITVGYSHKISERLSLGVRPKILFGKFFYETDMTDFLVSTDLDNELLLVEPQGIVTISGPVKVVIDSETENASIKPDMRASDYFFKPINMGAGIDLGLTYHPNEVAEISFSILDIGFTSANYNAYNVVFNGALKYKEDNLYQSYDPNGINYRRPDKGLRLMNNSFTNITEIAKVDNKKYEALPIQINAQFNYTFPNNYKLGLANHYTSYKNHSSNFFTGFIHTYLGSTFETVATLNLYNLNAFMFGLGGSYTRESAQFYLATNNILQLIRPTSAKNINLCFGVNFLLPID